MVVGVLVEVSNKNVDKVFEYSVPSDLRGVIKVGIRLLVPFGRRELEGFVLSIKDFKTTDKELKDIIGVVDSDIVLNEELLELGKEIQAKTLATLISCYQVMLPKALKAKNGRRVNIKYDTYYKLNGNIVLDDFKGSQREIVQLVKNKECVLRKEITDISISSLNTLIKKGILVEEKRDHYRLNYKNTLVNKRKLTDEQASVVDEVINNERDV